MSLSRLNTIDIDEFSDRGDREWHDVTTITLSELLESRVFDYTRDWHNDTFIAWPDAATARRVYKKFVLRFEYREIGILPPKRWLGRLRGTLSENVPKYLPIWQAIDEKVSWLTDGDEWHKGRDVYSEFPQTALGGSDVDYATNGRDDEYETLHNMGLLEYTKQMPGFKDPDVQLLDDLEPLFMGLMTLNINSFE